MEYLFQKHDLSRTIQSYQQINIPEQVKAKTESNLLSTSIYELVDEFVSQYRLDVPEILKDEIYIFSHGETTKTVSDFGRAVVVPAEYIELRVPFLGDPDLFQFKGNKWDTSPPMAAVRGNELSLVIVDRKLSKAKIEDIRDSFLGKVETYLGYIRDDCERWNNRISEFAVGLLSERKALLLEKSDLIESLGIPIRKRAVASGTFNVPIKQKKIVVRKAPRPSSELPFKPEPSIDDNIYNSILEVVERLTLNIERSPSTFSQFGEEAIRDLLLVNLNGHFEGQATGETFNGNGKTDILIRENNKNVFIAECKFWTGPKSLLGAIDQLLGYLTWRDTKSALVVFSRNKDTSVILKQIEELIQSHPNFRRSLGQRSESHFRFVLSQKDDPKRDLHLAILVFGIPSG